MDIFNKKHFTLLEVLVVLLLLSMGAAAIGVKVKDAYQEQRFYSEVDQMIDHLKLSQELMLILDHDVDFILVEDKDHRLSYSLSVSKPLAVRRKQTEQSDSLPPIDPGLSKKWKALVEKTVTLSAISCFSFASLDEKDLAIDPREEPTILKKTQVRFSLGSMSQGTLKLDGPGKLSRTIHLKGYPSRIGFVEKTEEKPEDRLMESKQLYPK